MSFELMLMGKNKKIKLDWSIENFDERVKHLDEIGLLEKHNGSSYIKKGLNDYVLENATTYLFRSKDIGSGRFTDYSHYRDESDYTRNSGMSKELLFTKDEKDNPDEVMSRMIEGLPNSDIRIEFYHDNEIVNRMFRVKNLDEKVIKNIIQIGVPAIPTIDDENLIEQIEEVYRMAISVCVKDEDFEVIRYLSMGMGDTEISNVMNVSKQAVSQRIKRIISRIIP